MSNVSTDNSGGSYVIKLGVSSNVDYGVEVSFNKNSRLVRIVPDLPGYVSNIFDLRDLESFAHSILVMTSLIKDGKI